MARQGRQTPTQSVILPYALTKGDEAAEVYASTGRTALEWQARLLNDIMAVDEEGLWTHSKFGYSIPRRNGKNEVLSIRELWGMFHGERILHTAHRTTTSSSASKRLAKLLTDSGYTEIIRVQKEKSYEKAFSYSKQFGLERITILGGSGGSCDFRTRTSKGGLGEGFDLLIIDEAQEYQDDQETSLKYVVSDSPNPQTIFCGTPPTPISSGMVFKRMRDAALAGDTVHTGWAEWSVEAMSDPRDKELWYQTNPSMGSILTERKILDEIGTDDADFNIQRLGLWLRYNQQSAISEAEWTECRVSSLPELTGKLYVGIKYGVDGTNVAMSVAVKTTDGRIFVEGIDCRPKRAGNDWMILFLKAADVAAVTVDGQAGQAILEREMLENKIRKPVNPTVREIIEANSMFLQAIYDKQIAHMGQPSLAHIVSNCEKRAIGSNGGFGFKSIKEEAEIALMDSAILAFWSCASARETKKQRVSY